MIDLTKPIQTRNGLSVRILCTDAATSEQRPIIGLIKNIDNTETLCSWYKSGIGKYNVNKYGTVMNDFDLINVPIKHKRWLNIYKHKGCATHLSKDDADIAADADRVACIEIEYTEGEGL